MTTTALVPVFTGDNGPPLCNARDLHATLENGDHFATWIKERIEKYGFTEGEDYFGNSRNRSDGRPGRRRTDYHLTLGMAKELAMVENNERGRQVRRYFIAVEKEARAIMPAAARPLLPAEQAEAIMERLNRLAATFHPLSDQFGDALGVIRALHGKDPRTGFPVPSFKPVLPSRAPRISA